MKRMQTTDKVKVGEEFRHTTINRHLYLSEGDYHRAIRRCENGGWKSVGKPGSADTVLVKPR